MKKCFLVLATVVVVGYLAAGVVAWRILPAKIAEAEQKRMGVTMALAKIANDQLMASRRISDVTSRTLGRGGDKVAQVTMLLNDSELNRLALTYMGSDWATMYSSFAGNVRHMRDLLKMQKDERKQYVSRLNEKIKELESRKRKLSRRMFAPSEERHWHIEMDDIERQLLAYRASNTYREYIEKDKIADNEIEAKAKNEAAIFKLASEYEAQTVGLLVQIMTAKATELRYDEAEPERLRHQMSYFNIWPLNKLAQMPLPEGE